MAKTFHTVAQALHHLMPRYCQRSSWCEWILRCTWETTDIDTMIHGTHLLIKHLQATVSAMRQPSGMEATMLKRQVLPEIEVCRPFRARWAVLSKQIETSMIGHDRINSLAVHETQHRSKMSSRSRNMCNKIPKENVKRPNPNLKHSGHCDYSTCTAKSLWTSVAPSAECDVSRPLIMK